MRMTAARKARIAELEKMTYDDVWKVFDAIVPLGTYLNESARENPAGWYADARTATRSSRRY
jgi:hypothetical protein